MKWNIVWTLWLIAIVVSFACFEGFALATGGTTLSRYVWNLSAAFPPFPYFAGFITGFLAAHFWWGGIVSFAPVKKSQP
jgi:hypothetical protein